MRSVTWLLGALYLESSFSVRDWFPGYVVFAGMFLFVFLVFDMGDLVKGGK